MEISLVTLDSLRGEMRALGKEGFIEKYPGAFLLAMGYLSVEAIQAGRRTAEAVRQDSRDATAAITFGSRLRHDGAQAHPLAGCAFYLRPTTKTAVAIGRSGECEITIPDNAVSEQHCQIEITDSGVQVLDTNSTNGTSVNLKRLEPFEPHILADEDILSVGRYSFQLLSSPTFATEIQLLNVLDD